MEPRKLPIIIAEIGFNHNGDIALAKDMIRAAAEAGADLVKFQTFRADDLALPNSPHFQLIRSGELRLEHMVELAEHARRCGTAFFSTPFSTRAVAELESVGVPAYKIASMDLTNQPLLAAVAATKKPVLLSTGMASLEEIGASLVFLQGLNVNDITLMHCLSLYPSPPEFLNLSAMLTLRERFGVKVGYSDHHPGVAACLAAFHLGAEVLETHFTMAVCPEGDHAHSADPKMLRSLIAEMKLTQIMGGLPDFFATRADLGYAKDFRRGAYAARELHAGQVLRNEDILLVRPASELGPNDLWWLVGSTLTASIPVHFPIRRTHIRESA